jgi:hypothetical protein
MENYYIDRIRSNSAMLLRLKAHCNKDLAGRTCIIIGSAPDPVIPNVENAYKICVNGSVHSAYKYFSSPPDLTYLNGAIFTDRDAYSNATRDVLRGKNIGDVLIARHTFEDALATLKEIDVLFGLNFPISKYDKRIIMAESMGYSLLGNYKFDANVSNGLFMSAVAWWCGASKVVLVGFSFNSRHEYSKDSELSVRGHLQEDATFLDYIASTQLPFFTTSKEIHANFGVKPWV